LRAVHLRHVHKFLKLNKSLVRLLPQNRMHLNLRLSWQSRSREPCQLCLVPLLPTLVSPN
jgi:hypothetical protein